MEQTVIEVELRTGSGKGDARKLRAAGKIPGVLYGHKQTPVHFTTDPLALRKKVKGTGMGRNTVLKISGLGRDVMALIKDLQIDPLRRAPIHLDLVEVRADDRIVVRVPVELVGKPEGVIAGGVLQAVRREVGLTCSPLSIPKIITVDVSHLKMNQALHISDIKFPEGTQAAEPGSWAVATVQAPRAEETAAPAAAAAAEGVEGAAPAEGAAAAAPAADKKEPEKKADDKKAKK